MNKIVYVTGCLGFIGSYITRRLLSMGYYVRGVDKVTYASNEELLQEFYENEHFEFEKKDINNLEFLYECDYFINCAAETHVGNSIVKSEEFLKSNIDGVHHLLELLRNYRQENGKTPIFIHFSTDEVYGDIKFGYHKETDILKPSNPYAATKAAADMLIQAWGRTYNIPYMILRPTNNYGIGQYVEKLIPKAIKYLTLGKPIPLHDNGKPYRTWLHVEDTVDALVCLINHNNIYLKPVASQIWNISGGFELTNIDVCKKIVYNLGYGDRENLYDLTVKRKGQDVRYALDDSKIRMLGWKPKADFDQELRKIVEHHKNKFTW